ncbi:hypothetical protein B0H21DRAFT_775908 [Amylocystis lapponica]|nr:hypothetical protein B0H21DRAFT_775908 [Amylocystis lapponica]
MDVDDSESDPPIPEDASEPGPPPHSRRTTVEEVDDEEAGGLPKRPSIQSYSGPAGSVFGTSDTEFEKLRAENEKYGRPPYHPFESRDEWDLARWLIRTGVSQTAIDEYLKLPITRSRSNLSFCNKRPGWACEPWDVQGDVMDECGNLMTESLELWKRNPVECIRELIGNPMFKDHIRYAPEKLYTNELKRPDTRIYDETWTGDWWWDTQVCGALPQGSTIAPVILSSDKTQLSQFSGDKSAWPPLIEAGRKGIDMVCSDGSIRRVHPIVAAYIADHPEQCLIACCKENFCPKCTVDPKERGEVVHSLLRDPVTTERVLAEAAHGEKPAEFQEHGIRLVDPFWKNLPLCDIFACITPDLLHQLHKGVFKDHLVSWATVCMDGADAEVDRQFKAMTGHPDLRHFKRGISLISQWTGTEYKNMEKVFLGVLTGASDPAVLRAVRAVLDFIYYAHFQAHSVDSLVKLDSAWADFHANKHVFVDAGVRDDFNIPKVHSADHYGATIRKLGTADGYNTENSERLHIDFAKRAYRSTNKKAYLKQMTTWLTRQEAISRFESFLTWTEPQDTAQEPTRFGQVRVNTLTDTFGCKDFLRTLEEYLKKQSRKHDVPAAFRTVHGRTLFGVYKRMKVKLPVMRQVSQTSKVDTIRATPVVRAKGLRTAVPAHFDTVLAREFPADVLQPNKGDPLDGLCVARVRAIFRIPADFGAHASEHPLAYVEWFTPFRDPVPDIGMHKVSHSTRNHRRRASIIPITQIERSCHLIPCWRREMVRSWTSAEVLDQCKTFYVNPYLRHEDFVLFRYLRDNSTA